MDVCVGWRPKRAWTSGLRPLLRCRSPKPCGRSAHGHCTAGALRGRGRKGCRKQSVPQGVAYRVVQMCIPNPLRLRPTKRDRRGSAYPEKGIWRADAREHPTTGCTEGLGVNTGLRCETSMSQQSNVRRLRGTWPAVPHRMSRARRWCRHTTATPRPSVTAAGGD